MNKKFFGLLVISMCCLVCLAASAAFAAEVAYIRGTSAPWGNSTNEAAMETVFGAGNWDDLRMADATNPFAVGAGYRFIFLEGGDHTANELSAYLQYYRAEIEDFVVRGGHLLLNSAPNEGGNIDFGFGGIQLVYPASSSAVVAADPSHPIFNGPFTPVVTSYTGGSFGHAIIGNGVTPIIIGAPGNSQAGNTVLGELIFGNGLVLFGGMTTNNFHYPGTEAANLRANIIDYTSQGAAPAIPTLNEWGMIIMSLLMAGSAFWFIRKERHESY